MAFATQEFLGVGLVLGLTLTLPGLDLELVIFWPH